MLVTWLFLLFVSWHCVDARCHWTKSGHAYPLTIGLLSASKNDMSTLRTIQEDLLRNGDVKDCFQPHYLILFINETLKIPQNGWTWIQSGIANALSMQGAEEGILPDLIIGPFYVNLAMMLQRMEIPYLVTDYKGFDWIDMNRVQDTVHWRTVVEIRPPAHMQNLAVVDLFTIRKWSGAMMVMPENAADNQECQDLAGQMLNHSLSVIPFTVDPHSHDFNMSVMELLRSAQIFRQNQILVCSPRDSRDKLIETILIQARPFGILQDKDYSFILVDPSSYLAPFSGASHMYRLGLFSVQCELLAFRYVQPMPDAEMSDESEAAASDAARVASYALSKYLTQQTAVTDEFSSERFLEALKSVQLKGGLTGSIAFDELGQRANYTLYLYNHGGEDMYQMRAKWNPNLPTPEMRLNETADSEEEEGHSAIGIFPDLVRIVVVHEKPFVMLREDTEGRLKLIDRYEGFTIDLIKRLAKQLKFTYEIYQSPSNRYGAETPDGSWDGMVGEVVAGNATLACGSISITSRREKVIDFSLGVLSTGVNLLIRQPQEQPSIFQFMMPFSLELWMAIVGASATVSLVFFVMDYCSEDRRFTVRETIWFTIGTLLKRGTDFAPVPVSQRILTAGFLFFVLITVSTYTANMAAFLTTTNFGETIDSFEDLADSKSVRVTTVKNSATMSFLKNSTKDVYRRLWGKSSLVEDAEEGKEVVKSQGRAFIFDYLINEAAENEDCDVKAVAAPILLQEHGIGMKAGAAFKSSINIELLKLKEEGFIASLKKKWWDDKRQCDVEGDSQRTGQVEFGLTHTAGVFIVSVFGVCLAALLFLGKKIYFLILWACQKELKQRKNRKEMERGSHDNNANDEVRKERMRLFDGDKGEAV